MSISSNNLDQFYTKKEIAIQYFNKLKGIIYIDNFDYLMEPSAGTGSFFNLLDSNKRIGLDLEPKCSDVQKLDFFDFEPETNKNYLVIGNPPFGKISSTAVKFFNKSAEFSNVIAFIIPRTFKRVSIQNKLNEYFHLIFNEDLPLKPCCFEPKMDAKCYEENFENTNLQKYIIYCNNLLKSYKTKISFNINDSFYKNDSIVYKSSLTDLYIKMNNILIKIKNKECSYTILLLLDDFFTNFIIFLEL